METDRRLIYFYVILLITAALMAGYTLNGIELHMTVVRVEAEGINYDAFREMRLPEKMIRAVRNAEALGTDQDKEGREEEVFDAVDSLTVYMMVKRYNLNKSGNISKRNLTVLHNSLYGNKSFQELKYYYKAILSDIKCFPVPTGEDGRQVVGYDDSWYSYRSYGGSRRHEGTDLMPEKNIRGYYHIISATDGCVEKLGWLEQGGYRIGIRGDSGAYFYYAHLDSYAPGLTVGDLVKAGQFLGFMGDSGYGKEGTKGKFDVHLHFGIYVETSFGELSVNPYQILRYLEKE